MPKNNELWAEIQDMAKQFETPLRVNARSRKKDLQIEHDRLTDISEGAERKGINEFKEEMDHKNDDEHKKKVRALVKEVRTWRKSGMELPLNINRNEYGNAVLIQALRIAVADIKILILIGDKTYTINQEFLDRLMNIGLLGGNDTEIINTSAEEFLMIDRDDPMFDPVVALLKIPNEDVKPRPTAGFFKHLSKSNYDLSRQQVFNKIDPKLLEDNCLIYALWIGGLPIKKLDSIKLKVKTRCVPAKDIRIITTELDIFISVKGMYSKNINRYGNPDSEYKFNLGLIDEHYFLIEDTIITKYAFTHNLEMEDWNIVDNKGLRNNEQFIDTFKCIKLLLKPELFLIEDHTISSEIFSTTYSSGIKEFRNLEYDPKEVREITSKAGRSLMVAGLDVIPEFIDEEVKSKANLYENSNVVFFDFETNISEKHKPFLCHFINKDTPDIHYGFEGYSCGEMMLRSLCSIFGKDSKNAVSVILYAHNAGYDYRFLIKYLKIEKILRQGSGLLFCSGKFIYKDKLIEVIIKDTYKLISKPLRDFGEMFNLETEKEVMPYSLQTNEHINIGGVIPMTQVMECFEMKDPEFKKAFLANCEKWECIWDDEFELFTYASKYCRIDCEVLHRGYEIFNGWMLETTGESIFNHLTIPSLVHEYFINKGCYTGVYELSGVCRAYIQKCVVGGRTALAYNKKTFIEEPIADFDAVSLYPSAMSRMEGFLKGTPQVLTEKIKNDEFLKGVSGYFIRIRITKIGIKRAFPLMSEMRHGVRCFENEKMVMFVDRTGLEDMVKFQDIKYDILDGYYFNEGHNDTIGKVINHLFLARIEKKKEGNPVQEVLKLVMNSSYGRTLLKPITHKDKVFNTQKALNKYVITNFSVIESYIKIHETTEKYILKEVIPVITHFNIPQVGVEVLSTSKRIMNEVICLAEDNKIEIYYQDTDSLHLKQDRLDDLMSIYFKKYNRVLSGDLMGQFNSDFKMKNCSGVHSVKFIGLGKKCYLDVLNGTRKDGTIETDFHIRMKGVPTSCVKYTADKLYGGNLVSLYEDMFRGIPISFDLLQGGSKCSFQTYMDLSINNRASFTRVLRF